MNKHAVSKVRKFNLVNNSNGSYVQFGDHRNLNAKSRGIAVRQMRYKTATDAGEPMFDQFKIFNPSFKKNELFHFPSLYIEVNKPDYSCEFPNTETEKYVDAINITIASNSSSILIGNGNRHFAEKRQKNIRQHFLY